MYGRDLSVLWAIPTASKWIRERSYFLYVPFLYLADGSIENRHSPNGASAAKPKEL